jgi:hypothetical protein
MIRHLTTLVLGGVLGSMVLAGNAEACHKLRCGHAPVACAAPAPVAYAAPCAPKAKCFSFKLPTLCHKKATCAPAVASCAPAPAPCAAAPVGYAAPAPVYYSAPVGYSAPIAAPMAMPQASMQH